MNLDRRQLTNILKNFPHAKLLELLHRLGFYFATATTPADAAVAIIYGGTSTEQLIDALESLGLEHSAGLVRQYSAMTPAPADEGVLAEVYQPADEGVLAEVYQPTDEGVLDEVYQPTDEEVLDEVYQPDDEEVLDEVYQPDDEEVLDEVYQPTDEKFLTEFFKSAPRNDLVKLASALRLDPNRITPAAIASQLIQQQIPKFEIDQAMDALNIYPASGYLRGDLLPAQDPPPDQPIFKTKDWEELDAILSEVDLVDLTHLVDHLLIYPMGISSFSVAGTIIAAKIPIQDVIDEFNRIGLKPTADRIQQIFLQPTLAPVHPAPIEVFQPAHQIPVQTLPPVPLDVFQPADQNFLIEVFKSAPRSDLVNLVNFMYLEPNQINPNAIATHLIQRQFPKLDVYQAVNTLKIYPASAYLRGDRPIPTPIPRQHLLTFRTKEWTNLNAILSGVGPAYLSKLVNLLYIYPTAITASFITDAIIANEIPIQDVIDAFNHIGLGVIANQIGRTFLRPALTSVQPPIRLPPPGTFPLIPTIRIPFDPRPTYI